MDQHGQRPPRLQTWRLALSLRGGCAAAVLAVSVACAFSMACFGLPATSSMQHATRCRQKRCQGGAGQWHADLLALLDKARGTGRRQAGGSGGGGGSAASGGFNLEAGDGEGEHGEGDGGAAAGALLDEESGSADDVGDDDENGVGAQGLELEEELARARLGLCFACGLPAVVNQRSWQDVAEHRAVLSDLRRHAAHCVQVEVRE